jgi:hypothetical protein
MSQYVFLYRGGKVGRSPERIKQSMQKWMAWFNELGQNGHIEDEGTQWQAGKGQVEDCDRRALCRSHRHRRRLYAEARDLEQAVELSKGCPILEVEGAVEVRPVMKINT